jgi:nitrate/nitrite transporter NarK
LYKLLKIGLDDRTLTTIGAISGAVNGCSRTAWAFLMDKFSFKFVIIIITFLNLLTSSLLGDATKTTGYLILISLIMACEGGILATFPAVTSKMFGNKVHT